MTCSFSADFTDTHQQWLQKKKGRAKQRTKKTLQEREEKTEAVAGEVK